MKLSIVTAALNAADGLGETFGSLLEQTHADWEFVVIDGGSQDATVDILHEWDACYPGRVRWVSESDGGIYDAMNKGIALSTGDAIGFLGCGDTFYDASSLRYIDEALSSGVDAVFGDLIFVTRADRSRPVRIWRGSSYRTGIFRSGWQPAHPTFFARRYCFDRYGGFDVSLAISADFDLMYRFLEVHGISSRYIPAVLVRMLNGGTSNGSLRNIMKAHRNIRRAFRKYGSRAPLFYSLRRLLPKLANAAWMRVSR